MLFDTNIFIRVRPANAARRMALLFVMIGVFGCDRSRNDPSVSHDGGPSGAATEYDADEAKRHLQEMIKAFAKERAEEQARFEAEIRELKRVRDLPPFENALEPKGWRRISRAFLVDKEGSGKMSITEQLVGRMPSDPERYVPEDRPAGVYLVGSMMPSGGYAIDDDRGEERFCLSLSMDGAFLEGEGVSASLPIIDVKRRLETAWTGDPSGVR